MAKKKTKILKIKKLKKDSQKYKDLKNKQGRLKSILHANWRELFNFKTRKSTGRKRKAPFTMAELEIQQKEINKIREQIGKRPISLFQDFKEILKHLG